MLLATPPGYRRECAFTRRCTCYNLPGQYGRRAARRAERRQWQRDLSE
ncbi:hypothetical protein [Streptomyces sp. NPDC058739]